jgi:hypothetical protein
MILKSLSKAKEDRYANMVLLREAFEQARPSGQRMASFRPLSPRSPEPEEKTIVVPIPSIPKFRLKFEQPRPAVKTTAPPSAPRQAGVVFGRPHLLGRRGDLARQGIPILEGNLTIGRGAQSQIRLGDRSVSRIHACIIRTRRGTYVRDEKSSLGTFVNGRRITGPTKLKHGDIIQIGYSNEFEYRER